MFQTMTGSTRTAKFGAGAVILQARGSEALSDDLIRASAPAVFAEAKHDSRSDRYTYIGTQDLLAGMRKEGFFPFEVRQGGSRDENKRGFTKHMIRFRRDDTALVGGDSKREVILLNSHDGTSSYQLMSGLFRMVCRNGIIACDGEMQIVRIGHRGNILDNVIDGAYRVIEDSKQAEGRVAGMQQLQLSAPEQNAFANAAAQLRWDAEDSQPNTGDLLDIRRSDDQGQDLWRTFNRVQENLVRGGIGYLHRAANGNRTYRHTRPVNGIDGNVSLNRALWVLASEMQKLKAA